MIRGLGLADRKHVEQGVREGFTQLQGWGRVGMLSTGIKRSGERF